MKLKSTHEEMMRIVANELHCLVNGDSVVPLVTDDERGFEAIEEIYQKWKGFYAGIMHAMQ